MKKIIALGLSLMFAVSLAACSSNVQTRDDANQSSAPSATTSDAPAAQSSAPASQEPAAAPATKPTINLLLYSNATYERVANVVRDQLTKNGFEVVINMQPDYSSYKALVDNGSYDMCITGWTTVTGNPDYAVRSLFKTGGDYNQSPVEDSVVDDFIEKASTETAEEYINTYSDFEKYLVEEKAYIVPLLRGIKTQGINTEVLKPESVRISQARSMVWEMIEFQDSSRNETDPVVLAQAISDLTSLDPIKGNDGSINQLNSNMYIRLLNLTDDDKVIPDGSLSYQFAIADGNENYYFVLRDDVNFAKVENMEAVDTGVRVGGEDVVFSLSRARDGKSVPNHRTYSLHESMQEIQVVTDIAEIEGAKTADGKSVKEVLESTTPNAITTLAADKNSVDNASGSYQVVKVTTNRPFPQVLNYLAHQSAGIVSKDQVESINTYDIDSYDVTKDIAYGDQSQVTEGPSYNNHLWTSGPYIMTVKNDYEAKFMRNPGYMPTTENYPIVKNYVVRFIADTDSQLSALRAGEIYVLYSVPETKVDLVTSDSKLMLKECPSNAVTYANFNLKSSIYADEDLRKAVLYSINQDEIIAVFNNRVFRAYSTLAPFIDTGNQLNADSAKVAEHLAAWAAK